MGTCMCGEVQGIGISDCIPEHPAFFRQTSVMETLKIPNQKPDMEQLLSVIVDAKVISLRIVDTCIGKSYEGQILGKKKLIAEVELKEKIKYVADEPTQSVHAAHYDNVLTSIFVIIPSEVNGVPVECLLQQNKMTVTPFIEDIFAEQLDKRTIFKNITILLDVRFNTCECDSDNNIIRTLDYSEWTYYNKILTGTVEVDILNPTLSIEQEPKNGKLEVKSDGSYIYTPNSNFVGEDSFTILAENDKGEKLFLRYFILVIRKNTVFKQMSIQENVTIPDAKPDVEDVDHVIVNVEITKSYPIRTPKSESYEGQVLSGWKLVVEGVIKQKIQYVADKPCQSVHSAHFDFPFSTFLVLPEYFNCGDPIQVKACLEDVFVKSIDKRNIFKNITFLIEGKIC